MSEIRHGYDSPVSRTKGPVHWKSGIWMRRERNFALDVGPWARAPEPTFGIIRDRKGNRMVERFELLDVDNGAVARQ